MNRARRKLEQAASAARQLRVAIEQKFVETGNLELSKTLKRRANEIGPVAADVLTAAPMCTVALQ